MTKEELEAQERGEEIAPAIPESPENSGGLGEASGISSDDLIADDTDSPKADNKLPPPDSPVAPGASNSPSPDQTAGNVNPPPSTGPKKRGRKPMTDAEKAQSKQIREAIKAGKPAPDFSSLNTRSGNGQPQTVKAPRDYYLEACSIFVPVSAITSKLLGPHWGVPIVDKEINGLMQKTMEPTEEQKQYLAQMARWLEHEQFPEISPRWGFVIATAGYVIPKTKQDPTPERLSKAWEWVRVKILRREPRTVKQT